MVLQSSPLRGITEALFSELSPLGIHATVIKSGSFRADFMDASSLAHTVLQIDDYQGNRRKDEGLRGRE